MYSRLTRKEFCIASYMHTNDIQMHEPFTQIYDVIFLDCSDLIVNPLNKILSPDMGHKMKEKSQKDKQVFFVETFRFAGSVILTLAITVVVVCWKMNLFSWILEYKKFWTRNFIFQKVKTTWRPWWNVCYFLHCSFQSRANVWLELIQNAIKKKIKLEHRMLWRKPICCL